KHLKIHEIFAVSHGTKTEHLLDHHGWRSYVVCPMSSHSQSPVAPISQQIWDMKYRLRGADGAPLDNTVEDTWRRVAKALAQVEPKDREHWAQRFYSALADYCFLPAGRILAGAGTGRQVTLFNCFVMGDVPDDMNGIFQNLKE